MRCFFMPLNILYNRYMEKCCIYRRTTATILLGVLQHCAAPPWLSSRPGRLDFEKWIETGLESCGIGTCVLSSASALPIVNLCNRDCKPNLVLCCRLMRIPAWHTSALKTRKAVIATHTAVAQCNFSQNAHFRQSCGGAPNRKEKRECLYPRFPFSKPQFFDAGFFNPKQSI